MKRWYLAVITVLALLPGSLAWAQTATETLENDLQSADTCSGCHIFDNPVERQDEPSYAPWNSWSGSMMAHATRDPIFWAAVAVGHQDGVDEGVEGITEECIRCHTPRAYFEGRRDAIAMSDLDEDDLYGVECDFCHRTTGHAPGPGLNAQYIVDDDLMAPKRGPWDLGEDFSFHGWAVADFLATSEFCGMCHDVNVPNQRLNDAGEEMGTFFNEQRTFSEWQNSVFSEEGEDFSSCQDCHMPAVANAMGSSFGTLHEEGGRRHDLAGANRQMVLFMRDMYGNEADDAYYDQTIAVMDELLATAATLDVTVPEQVDLATGISEISVTVTNNTGHKLPTGYSEGRIMWLEVTAEYDDEVIYSSGLNVPGEGPEEGDQLRTYQGSAERFEDNAHFHLLLNDHWIEDTRIPPRGMVEDVETDPVTDRYMLQEDDTWPHWDTTAYTFPARDDVEDATPEASDDDEVTIRVRLLYLINSADYTAFLQAENETNDAGDTVAALFADGAEALVLAEFSEALPLTGLIQPVAGDDGTADAGDADAGDGDAGGVDAGDSDTGAPDAGDSDTGAPDAGGEDSGAADLGADDTGSTPTDGGSQTDTASSGTGTSDDDGCGCTTGRRPATSWAWLAAILGLALIRRRR